MDNSTPVPPPVARRGGTLRSEAPSFDRAIALARLRTEHFDVVVIGGGITGAGVALDCASRGLRTALIEKGDWASGTSSKSSKFVHGGLRYLQQGDYRLVYEALRERQRLLKNAPHLVSVLPFVLPVMAKGGVVPKKLARALGSAMWLYDLTGGLRIGKIHRRLSVDEALGLAPVLPTDRLAPSYLYYDCAADDARLTLSVAQTAAAFGAAAANRVSATSLTKTAAGFVDGVGVLADGECFTISTAAVVNATGVWADEVRAFDERVPPHTLRPAKGVHAVVPAQRLPIRAAVILPVPGDRRSIFLAPWESHTYIGTTDTEYAGPLDHPTADAEDLEYLIAATNRALRTNLNTEHITASWAGLRPLVAPEHEDAGSGSGSKRTADLSRQHSLRMSRSGVATITGGKLTTYREMAEDTVDALIASCFPGRSRALGPSRTANLRLFGGAITPRASKASAESPLDQHLLGRFGSVAGRVTDLISAEPSLGEPLIAGLPYIRAEVVYAIRHEMASSIGDILLRRTRAGFLDRAATLAAAPWVASTLATELGWDENEREIRLLEFLDELGDSTAPLSPTSHET